MQIKTVTKLKTRSSVEIKMHKTYNADHIDYLGVYLTEDKYALMCHTMGKVLLC